MNKKIIRRSLVTNSPSGTKQHPSMCSFFNFVWCGFALFLMTIDETFDIGSDTRTGVDDNDYHVPFKFTGTIDNLTIKLEPAKMAAEEEKARAEAIARVND